MFTSSKENNIPNVYDSGTGDQQNEAKVDPVTP